MTPILNAGLSGGFITLAAAMAVLAWRDARLEIAGRLLTALGISLACLEIATGPIGDVIPTWLSVPLRIIGAFNVGFLWLFCLALLRDGFRLQRLEWVGLVVFSIGPFANVFGFSSMPEFSLALLPIAIAPIVAIGHVVWVALSERAGDLVEQRQKGRVWLAIILAVAALISVASESIPNTSIATLVRLGVASLPCLAILIFWLTSIAPAHLRFETEAQHPALPVSNVDPRDQILLNALVETMSAGLYREPALSIDDVAKALKVPTHRLRAVINQGLGYRNFAAFVNSYRLTFTKNALGDPRRGRETVLAIAYEAGFASLQTFNRVFKDNEGDTPTEYREKSLREAAQNQKIQPISDIG
jgi:AraC-like DNA-binding protein